MRSLVTGVDGFIGSWLAEALLAAGDRVFGLSRAAARGVAAPADGVARLPGDVVDGRAVEAAVRAAAPERIFHLAAQNNIQASFADPAATFQTNILGSLNLLEAVRAAAPAAAVVSVGSSAEYGRTAATVAPLREDLPLEPTSPYGVSKASQGQLCRVYADVHRVRVVHVRPFAIVGPRKTKDAVSDFCRNVVAIERGETERFSVGPLEAERDFVDVRDAVAALLLLSTNGVPGTVYNLCNGRSATLQTVLSLLGGLSRRPFQPTRDPARLRPSDDLRIIGDSGRLRALGYAPAFSLSDTIAATLEHWRGQPS